jgi:hypothetical protein
VIQTEFLNVIQVYIHAKTNAHLQRCLTLRYYLFNRHFSVTSMIIHRASCSKHVHIPGD